ncbi:MAG: DUF2851 family protein [Candidatus Cloacimonetes bacterium]|nr:DUF2851 family protein [Candidatus Cloacimonadota bacterium]MCF7813714.1 DUF2851 family protein [Candidatus Cloacimonadota bacterium]MCF7867780.1 DUF2851 family protein [Candidatus Cloacimonadota bacterium]MCF7883242.1 DUF2851 family protein [Candidatus Cloacimonadota bacterium]
MHLTERFLYHIWDAQHIVEELTTISHKKMKILFPGRWNTDSGPDFKDAIIEIDGEVMRGDVEIELETYNWKVHEHHENPAFNSVILQVVYEHNGQYKFNFNEDGTQFEILELKDFLNQDINKLTKKYLGKNKQTISKSCRLINNMNQEKFRSFLIELGNERFYKKIKRFTAEHYFADFEQLLYQGLLESLGYSKNKYQMIQLAMKIPYKKIKQLYTDGMKKDHLIALYLCSSDLINHLPSTFPLELKNKWIDLFHEMKLNPDQIPINWKLFRIRPVNHPAIRILQVVEILYRSLETSIFKEVLKLFSFSIANFKLSELKKKNYNYFQTTPDFLPEKYKLGKTRIDTIVVNIILPLIIVYAKEKSYADLEQNILKVYQKYPGLPKNYITNFMENFLPDPYKKIVNRKAINQQGIIKLYFDQCKYHDCEECS